MEGNREKLKVITKNSIGTLPMNFLPRPTLRQVAERWFLVPPISVKNMIRLAELPPPEIEEFKANPVNVPMNSKSTLSWKVKNCENSCNIFIEPKPGHSSNPDLGRLKAEGSLQVTVPSNAEYRLDASFAFKGNGVDETVSVTVTTGFSSIRVLNSHSENRGVFVWIRDRSTTFWQDKGILEFGKSITIPLQDQRAFELVCVDPSLPVCSGNHPDEGPCRKLHNQFIPGASNGPILDLQVF